MIKLIAEGEMYVDGGKKGYIREEFREEFLVHPKFGEANRPNQVVQHMLINARLKKKYPEFADKVKTCDARVAGRVNEKPALLSWEDLETLGMMELREYAAQVGVYLKGSILGRTLDIRKRIKDEVGVSEQSVFVRDEELEGDYVSPDSDEVEETEEFEEEVETESEEEVEEFEDDSEQ